ncbi:hypothetical protein Tco_0697168, partial [Tanacetum coccineum]
QYESTLYSWANLKDFSEDFQGTSAVMRNAGYHGVSAKASRVT